MPLLDTRCPASGEVCESRVFLNELSEAAGEMSATVDLSTLHENRTLNAMFRVFLAPKLGYIQDHLANFSNEVIAASEGQDDSNCDGSLCGTMASFIVSRVSIDTNSTLLDAHAFFDRKKG